MLKTWTLSRFKSAYNETRLDLAPLTVFAGANSSGKSTVIQSMLLTAQTLQSSVQGRPVVLNGHIARLGEFKDIVSNANEEENVGIGFELIPSRPGDSRLRLSPSVRPVGAVYYRRLPAEALTSLECQFKFSVRRATTDREIARLQPLLDESSLRVRTAEDLPHEESIVIRSAEESLPDRIAAFQISEEFKGRPETNSLRYEVTELDPKQVRGPRGVIRAGKVAGAYLVHFLPSRVAIVYDAVEAEVQQLVDSLLAAGPEPAAGLEESLDLINNDLLNMLVREFKALEKHYTKIAPTRKRIQQSLDTLRDHPSPAHLLQFYKQLPLTMRGVIADQLGEKVQNLLTTARAGRAPRYEMRYAPLPPNLAAGVDLVLEFFNSMVKYLGPLRDEPKPVYPLAGATDPRDVGFKGEHTAAVLDVNRNALVTYVPSKAFGQAELGFLPQPSRLLAAVLDWLKYMGVGTKVAPSDQGKLGHELKIATSDASSMHDLTQVGVGVSQVLPILVLSLLAESGSTLIFEQPELHLHPRVQARLADFLVSMTKLGKQCIVETHSEYLINRLRYLAAISEGKEISGSSIIYFVEKEGAESTYRKVLIDEFGVIPDWPRGFFDESEQLAAAVLRAGVGKRKVNRDSK